MKNYTKKESLKKFTIKSSAIKGAGKGLFADNSFKKGEIIGLAHVNGKPTNVIGKNHNHNEKKPTAVNIQDGNKRYLIASKNLKSGEEITTNYKLQPELEQPEDFMRKGGIISKRTIKKSPRSYSKNIMATNKLFIKNKLFKKPKSAKNKIYDPNSPYYDNGGIINQEEIDASNMAMMKARLAYANEFGNPAAKRMINLPDNPYYFNNGDTGSHYMASMDNYAVPQIQDENGILQLGDYGPESNEAIRFDSDEDANYFAENYKDVSPGFMELELDDAEIKEYKRGGYIVEELDDYQEGGEPCPEGQYWNGEECIPEMQSIVQKPPYYQEPIINPAAYVNSYRGDDPRMYKYGFLESDQGNVIGGGGFGFPKPGVHFNALGVVPTSANDRQYFKGAYEAGISKDLKNLNLGLGVGTAITGYPGENGFVRDPIKFQPRLNLKYNFAEGGGLNEFVEGGVSGCPKNHVWDSYTKKCVKVYTLANDQKLIDGVGNWAMHSADPDKISLEYNDQIKRYLYSGNYGYDPVSMSLYKLPKEQRTVADAETKRILAKQDDKAAYRKSIIDAGFDPETFGKSKGTNVITGEKIYGDKSKEDVDKINKEAINNFVIEGHRKAILESPFNMAAYFTPAGMAAGVMQGAANLLPDVYNFGKDPSWSTAGAVGMDALMMSPAARGIGKFLGYVPKQLLGSPVTSSVDDVGKLNIDEIMSLSAPKGNMYGQNQVLIQQARLLDPKIKAKFFKNQAPVSGPQESLLQKMPKDYNNRITPENYDDFVKKIHGSTYYNFAQLPKTGANLGIGSYGKPGMVYKDAPLNNLGKDIIAGHEKNHGMFAGTMSKEMTDGLLKPFGTRRPVPNYPDKHQGDEVFGRMAQFKNAVGIGNNQTFTLGHLNFIRKNYAKNFLDNGITEMLSKLKPGSAGEKEFLINMNKYAFTTAGAAIVTGAALQKKKHGGLHKFVEGGLTDCPDGKKIYPEFSQFGCITDLNYNKLIEQTKNNLLKQEDYKKTRTIDQKNLRQSYDNPELFKKLMADWKTKYPGQNSSCPGEGCPEYPLFLEPEPVPPLEEIPPTPPPLKEIYLSEYPDAPDYYPSYYGMKVPTVGIKPGKTKSKLNRGKLMNGKGKKYKHTTYRPTKDLDFGTREAVRPIPAMVQKLTGYDRKFMEGYEDKEGNYFPGEIEKAEEEGRQINFKGASSLRDKKEQERYNKEFKEYNIEKDDIKEYNLNLLKEAGITLEEYVKKYGKVKYGGFIELELDDEQIRRYRNRGYIVEELN